VQPWKFHPGDQTYAASDAIEGSYSAYFEDDGETGYFYGCLREGDGINILDAMQIYNVANVSDRDKQSELYIFWSNTYNKCALVINGYPHAAFDFVAKRGWCRTNFPNFERKADGDWMTDDHSWSDDAVEWMGSPEGAEGI
jgi:hypothetical protein